MGKQWRQWLTIFLGSKITADGDCSHEIKRRLLLGRKVMTNPRQHIKKQRQQAPAPLQFLPDEARSLPPPKLTDPRLAFVGFLGYCRLLGLLLRPDWFDNAIRQRPVLSAGLHRQLLYITSFVFAGYYLLKRQDYMYAVRDHDMFSYIKSHPEDFPEKR